MIVCIAEDRPGYEVPLQLLILSLARHSPSLRVHLFYPVASARFACWVARHPGVTLSRDRLDGAGGWNVKPHAFGRLFDLGYDEVVWIDSDIVVAGDISGLFSRLDHDTVCASEESAWGQSRDREHELWRLHRDSGALRAAMWNLPVGRFLPHSVNSAVLRLTTAHRPLLARWVQMLASPEYRDAQAAGFDIRPLHLVGDQDVLAALLASAEFSAIPLRLLRRGQQILQFMGLSGYTVAERIRSIAAGMPMLIHAQAMKPWTAQSKPGAMPFAAYVRAVYADTSPYTLVAMQYRDALAGDAEWMRPRFRLSRWLRIAGLGYPPLVGLPVAFATGMARLGMQLARRMRR